MGAALGGAGGEGGALLAGGVVAQVAHRVEGFASAAGGDDEVTTGEVAGHGGDGCGRGGG